MQRGDYDGAIVAFGEAIGFNMNNMQAYFKRGQCFYHMNNLNDAINDFSHILEFDDKNVDARLWRGTANARSGNHDAAVKDFLSAIRLDPQLAKKFAEGGTGADAKPGKPDNQGAVHDYEKAMALYMNQRNADELPDQNDLDNKGVPRNFRTKDQLAQPGQRNTKGQRARRRVAEATSDGDQNDQNAAGEADGKNLDKPTVRSRIAKLNNAIEQDERNSNLLYRRGMLYERLENYDQALADLSKAINLTPMDSRFYLERARIYHITNQPDLEQADVAKARSVDPTVPAHVKFVPRQATPQRQNHEFKEPVQ
jgi:tetratricopeptide (TPR) repeat protein